MPDIARNRFAIRISISWKELGGGERRVMAKHHSFEVNEAASLSPTGGFRLLDYTPLSSLRLLRRGLVLAVN